MTSNTETPCKKTKSKKHDSSTSFTDDMLRKVTLRTQKKKKSKRRVFATVDEDVHSQTDSFSFTTKLHILDEETSLHLGKVAKNNKDVKSCAGIETQVEAIDNYCRKLKKHEKKKKHKYSESYIEIKDDTVVSGNYSEKKLKTKELKNRISSERVDVVLNESDTEKSVVVGIINSSVTKTKDGKPSKRKSSLRQSYLDNTVSDDNDTSHCSTVNKILNKCNQDGQNNKTKDSLNLKYLENNCNGKTNVNDCNFIENEQSTQCCNEGCKEFSGNCLYKRLNNTKHISAESDNSLGEPKKKASVSNHLSSSDCNKSIDKRTKYKENKTQNGQEVVLNTHCVSGKELKKRRKNSSILEHNHSLTTLDESVYCDVEESNKNIEASCNENRDFPEMSSLDPKEKKKKMSVSNHFSSSDFNKSMGKKYKENETQNCQKMVLNNQCISKKELKKQMKKSFILEPNQSLTTRNESMYYDVKEPNRNEGASSEENCDSTEMSSVLVAPQKSYVPECNQPSSSDSTQLVSSQLQENDTQSNQGVMPNNIYIPKRNLKKTKERPLFLVDNQSKHELPQNTSEPKTPNALENNNELYTKKIRTIKEKVKKKINHNSIFEVEKNKKDLILTTKDFNITSSKSTKNDMLNDLSQSEDREINIKPNDKPSVVVPKIINKAKLKKTKAKTLSLNKSYKSLNKSPVTDIEQMQQDLLSAALKSLNKSHKSNQIKGRLKTVKNGNFKEPRIECNKKEKNKAPKVLNEDKKDNDSAMQSKSGGSMPNQALFQPCTSQDVETIGKVKKVKKPKTISLHKVDKKNTTTKTVKHKSKLNQDRNFDIEKMQQKLLAAALKNINSVPEESEILDNPELNKSNTNNPTKCKKVVRNDNSSKSVKEEQEKPHVVSKKKLKSQSIRDPLEDLTAKLLSAELKKRKGLKS